MKSKISNVKVFSDKPQGFSPSVEVTGCFVEHDNKFLYLKRSPGKPQENTWGIPAGKLEKGETTLQAVIRETYEEVGIRLYPEKVLHDLGPVFVRYPHIDFVFHIFHQQFSQLPTIHLSDEHQEYRWITFETALQLPLISGGKEVIYHFQTLSKKGS